MAFELDYDIRVSPDKKMLLLVDYSKYHESRDPLLTKVEVKLKTYLSVFGSVPNYKVVPATFAEGNAYGEGTIVQILASDINEDGSEILLDNIYDIIVTLYAPYTIFESSEANLTEFITNEFEVLNIFEEYDYIKIGEVYYSNSNIPPGSASESDFDETELAPIDSIEKNNTEGLYPLCRWYVDMNTNGISICTMTNEQADSIIRNEAAFRILMSNTEYGDNVEVTNVLEYFYPLVNKLITE